VYTGGLKVLLDAGLGPRAVEWEPTPGAVVRLLGGGLPGSLLALGLRPDDIDVVLLSHLHGDHSGWIWQEGRPFFPNAMVRFGTGDWTTFVEEQAPGADSEGIRALAEMGRVELIERDGEVAPGITSLHTPGHTPGHQTFVVSSGQQRALFLGDALSCPLQIEEPELEALADMDRRLGIETRERLLREVEEGEYVSGPHFPDVRFGRMIAGNGALHWN
jgi:glyoxylase-like metal-dependent hydrolase (beta-lactamase superfamily II)